jgi:hypothetical protein
MDNGNSRPKGEGEREGRKKVARQTGRKYLRKARKKRVMNVKYMNMTVFFIYKDHVFPFCPLWSVIHLLYIKEKKRRRKRWN